jgi:cytochrome c peroxidase
LEHLECGGCGPRGFDFSAQLAARAPYFSNGSAKNLRELVDYYDRRFDMRLTEQEKQDLINFLGVSRENSAHR